MVSRPFPVEDGRGIASPDGDGLEVLGTHDRAGPCAARLTTAVVGDAGEADAIFARGTDAGDPESASRDRL